MLGSHPIVPLPAAASPAPVARLQRGACGGLIRRRRLLLALLLLPLVGMLAPPVALAEPAPAAAKVAQVSVVIDFGDGAQWRYNALPWRDKMTALDALAAVKAHRRGVNYVQRGTGAHAMITQIGDLKNQGDGKNWLYEVNGKPAEVGAGALTLQAGDAVLWKFQTYDYNP